MKRILCALLALTLLLSACGQKTETNIWQEQYDLGIRYLEEGNYEEAILAFTAAIEIDPKRPEAYVGRGGAYVFSRETEENLTAAQADYEAALALDETLADAWLGLADVYIRRGDYDKAQALLQEALEKTGNDQSIADKLAEMEGGEITDSANRIRRSDSYDMEGVLKSYTLYEYDLLGRLCSWSNYDRAYNDQGAADGDIVFSSYCEVEFDEHNRPTRNQFYDADGTQSEHDSFVYNDAGQKVEQWRYFADGSLSCYFYFYYDEQGREIKYEGYNEDGMYAYWISEYDEAGNFLREIRYAPDGTQESYSIND